MFFNLIWNSSDSCYIEKLKEFPRTDSHCHTIYSDGCMTLEQLVARAKKSKFSIAIKADHNTLKGNRRLAALAKDGGLLYIPAVEMSTQKGHMVVLNLEEDDIKWVKKAANTFEELIERIHEQNGVAVMAHPWWRNSLHDEVFTYKELDGFEALNHSSPFGSLHFIRSIYSKPEKYLEVNRYRITPWVGSDSHAGFAYGHYYNIFLTHDLTRDGIVEAMRKGKVIGVGPLLPLYEFIVDGLINQPRQLKKELFYKNR